MICVYIFYNIYIYIHDICAYKYRPVFFQNFCWKFTSAVNRTPTCFSAPFAFMRGFKFFIVVATFRVPRRKLDVATMMRRCWDADPPRSDMSFVCLANAIFYCWKSE